MKDVLRTEETVAYYRQHRKENAAALASFDLLSLPIIREWRYWVMVENEFPYDQIASKHMLLVPNRRFVNEKDMHTNEYEELRDIKEEFSATRDFDAIMENVKHNRTVPNHYHLHCIKYRYVTSLEDLS